MSSVEHDLIEFGDLRYDDGRYQERDDIIWWLRHDPDVKALVGIREVQVLSEWVENRKYDE